jgi:hypothetical protein
VGQHNPLGHGMQADHLPRVNSRPTKVSRVEDMVDLSQAMTLPTYEVRLHGDIPSAIREQFREMTIHRSPATTILYREVTDAAELDVLLEKLQAIGLELWEIRESSSRRRPAHGRRCERVTTTNAAGQELSRFADRYDPVVWSYEVLVEGRLGSALLRYLRWSIRVQPEQSVVRIRTSPGDLYHFLASCTDCGLTLEWVIRLNPVGRQAEASLGGP